ncbi:MAG: ribonuclease HII [Bdellovibrionales bacterium]|nr:ribonuclease HII [Bdellovibrionales bacterium]
MKESMKRIWEKFPWEDLKGTVIGVDEAGRGCLAGRVYAAAVILDANKDNTIYTDSKLLSESKREKLAEIIKATAKYGIGYATVEEIDQINIFQASMLAMKRAVDNLGLTHGHLLVDGNKTIPNMLAFEQTALVKGDLRASPISAASILAKVERDRYIYELAKNYPQYGFEQHKAYATKLHKDAIKKWGPLDEHRKTFAGVKEFI